MKTKDKIISLLNKYIVVRELAKTHKAKQEAIRDEVVELLPPNTANEWDFNGWGRVTYIRPKDSFVVDLLKLKASYPEAFKACVGTAPNEPRFSIYPTKAAYLEAFKKESKRVPMENARKV